jgi:hypothetical protein
MGWVLLYEGAMKHDQVKERRPSFFSVVEMAPHPHTHLLANNHSEKKD